MPFWDTLRTSVRFRRALAGTNAAVVGLGAALYMPVWTSAVTGLIDVAIVAAALGLLMARQAPPIIVVAVCAAAGQPAAWL